MLERMNTKDQIQAMLDAGMSQRDIEWDSGISQASISRIISGKQVDLRLSTVEAIDALYRKARRRK